MHESPSQERPDGKRGTRAIIIATGFSAVAVLAFQAIASRTLGPHAFAPLALLWTLMFLLHTVLLLPAEQHLTRALVVTRSPAQILKIAREMGGAFAVALVVGTVFTAATLDRFFDGSRSFVALIALIVATRSLMSAGRGLLAGQRRFEAYGASIALESGALVIGAAVVGGLGGDAIAFGFVLVGAPIATLLARPFAKGDNSQDHHVVDAQAGTFLIWLVAATAASQLIIAGGPIAVSFVGGNAAAVSIFFTSFALLRGPLTSAYNLVARVLPDFTELAHSSDPNHLWRWAPRLTIGGLMVSALGAAGSGLLLGPIVETIYGPEFAPTGLMASLGGAGVGLGLGALFATQVYSAANRGAYLAMGWAAGLLGAMAVLLLLDLAPIDRVALAFVVGEGGGLLALGLLLPPWAMRQPA